MDAHFQFSRRQLGTLLVALSAAVVAACGGGGSATDSTTAGVVNATSYAAGPISGFGSVIVNGIRYDDSKAEVLDDEDGRHGRDGLKLGMMVEVDGAGVDRALAVGRALRIRFGSEIVGPVTSIDPAAGMVQVLGQTVVLNDATVFDDDISGGLAGLSLDAVVEVYAQLDIATGEYKATRVELKPEAGFYKLHGPIANVDPVAKTFTIGGALINYANVPAAEAPVALADGMSVRVMLRLTPVDGQWIGVRLRRDDRKLDDRVDADLRGTVTVITSTADFEVNGLRVDASSARFPDGTAGLVLGAEVEVKGAVVAGVLVATEVELEDRHMGEHGGFELHGLISNLSTDAKTFTLRGVTVAYGGDVSWNGGSEALLVDGVKLEVKGRLSADRTQLVASRINFE